MALSPIISWQTGGKKVEVVIDFLFLGSKITVDGDCSHEIKRCLLLGRKVMTNLDSILKSRDITLLAKVCMVKAMVFPIVKYGYESWTINKAKCWRIDAFELWCWRRFLRVPWTARRSNQSILKEINPKYLLEGLMLKLKLQYFGHPMWTDDSLEKTLMLGKIEGKRRRGQQRMRWLDGITDSMDMKSYGVSLNLTQGKGRTIQQNRIKGSGMGKKGIALHLLATKSSWFNKVLDHVYAHILWLVIWAKNYISIQNNSNDALCLCW